MSRAEWMDKVVNYWDGPLTREEVDDLWRECATGCGPVGDFGDAPIIELLLTIERGFSAQ